MGQIKAGFTSKQTSIYIYIYNIDDCFVFANESIIDFKKKLNQPQHFLLFPSSYFIYSFPPSLFSQLRVNLIWFDP